MAERVNFTGHGHPHDDLLAGANDRRKGGGLPGGSSVNMVNLGDVFRSDEDTIQRVQKVVPRGAIHSPLGGKWFIFPQDFFGDHIEGLESPRVWCSESGRYFGSQARFGITRPDFHTHRVNGEVFLQVTEVFRGSV